MTQGKAILLIVTGGFLAFTSGAWVFMFWYILTRGAITLYEPIQSILIAELSLAITLTFLGIGGLIYGAIKG